MTDAARVLTPEVLIVGGGPAGLTAAAHLASRLAGEVLVLEREQQAGGIPRHSDHLGYGTRDMRRFISGPAYAQRLVRAAETAGATIRTQAMVTGWDADGNAEVTCPQGRLSVRAKAVVLATGARERLLHPVDTADIAALDGQHVAGQVAAWLAGRRPDPRAVRLRAQRPFRWVAPGLLRPGDPAPSRRRLLLWSDALVRAPRVTAIQDGRVIGLRRLPWPASPGGSSAFRGLCWTRPPPAEAMSP
jgi:glycine/D-amino acid oxidase-like deaminating enzyme